MAAPAPEDLEPCTCNTCKPVLGPGDNAPKTSPVYIFPVPMREKDLAILAASEGLPSSS